MSKHTPGPWHANGIRNGRIIGGADAEFAEKIQINGPNTTIATVYRGKDAHLIAAAPELLEALRYMLTAQGQPFDHADRRASITQARAAIAKAEGGAS